MKQIITTSLTLIFVMLAGAVHAGDCMRLCDNEFWKTEPTVEQLQSELDKGADLSGVDLLGKTPLHFAAYMSRPEHIQFLIKEGANIEVRTDSNKSRSGSRTPLHYAAVSGKLTNLFTLIQAGADVDAKDSNNRKPLIRVVRRQKIKIVNALLDAGANARLRDYRKESAFDYARGNPDWIKHLSTYRRLKAASGE